MVLLQLACISEPGAPPLPPADAAWAALDPLPIAIQEVAVVAVGDEVWVIGGIDDALTPRDEVWILDAGGAWRAGPTLPAPVHHANAAVLDGSVHVLGALVGLTFDPVDVAWRWDPVVERWTDLPAVPQPIGASAVGVVDGRILLAGGISDRTTGAGFAFQPSDASWTALPDLPGPLDHAVGAGGSALRVFGGRRAGIDDVRSTVSVLEQGTWTDAAPLPTARAGAAGGTFSDGTIAVLGGEGDRSDPDGVFDEAELFDPTTGLWSALPSWPVPRHGTGAAAWNGGLVVPGGATVRGFHAVSEVDWIRR
jgi:hypothetical protein